MRTSMPTPSERLRPRMGRPRIDYGSDGIPIVRRDYVRMDPQITPGERRFDHFREQLGVALFWLGVVPGTAFAFYWGLTEGTKIVYDYAFHHPFGL